MRGKILQRGKAKDRWTLVFDAASTIDPTSGKRLRNQQWVSFTGTPRQAEKKLNQLMAAVGKRAYVDPTKLTLGQWLDEWLKTTIEPSKAPATTARYGGIVKSYLKPRLGATKLQELRVTDVEKYYADLTDLSSATKQIHHAVLHGALSKAVKNDLVVRNVAAIVDKKPKQLKREGEIHQDAVWNPADAKRFLEVAKEAGTQPGAFYALALDSGARRGELAALRWTDLNTATGRLTISRSLRKGGKEPDFGPTKTNTVRVVQLSAETLALLKTHRSAQAEVKLKNRIAYNDLGLMFAKEGADVRTRTESLGNPLAVNTIAEREFNALIRKAGIRRIRFHDLRHTCATLLLLAGVNVKVVQHRLGHSKIATTMDIYTHVLPSMEADAAMKLAALLHG